MRASLWLALVLGWGLATAAAAHERAALVIGNGAYVHAPALATPANDAGDVAQALGRLGFDVTVATDLDRNGMQERLAQFAARLGGATVALFYFSGLGLQVGDTPHLAGIDVKPSDDADISQYTVPVPAVLQALAGPGRNAVILVDASRASPQPSRPASGVGGALIDPPGTMIAFSTAPGSVLHDSRGRNSVYAAALVAHLATRGAPLDAVMRRVRSDVAQASGGRQVPWESSTLPPGFALAPAP